MNMFYTYVLKSKKNDRFYTGYTNDLRKRFNEHNEKKSKYTKYRGPYELIYYEACLNQDDAKRREKYLKTSTGRRMFRRRIIKYIISKSKI